MHNKYLEQATQKLKDRYQVDLISDILLGKKDRVLLFADVLDPKDIWLEVISNKLSLIGFPDHQKISFNHMLSQIDYQNKYAEVAGIHEYKDYVYGELFRFDRDIDVTIPLKTELGKTWVRFNAYPISGHPNLITLYLSNVTDLMIREEELYAKTHKDPLTGLFNKYTFDYHYGKRYLKDHLHVMYLDIDNFKVINDAYGHPVGNWYLVEFARLLKTFETTYTKFYRIGGDEFIGLIFESSEIVKEIAQTIINQTHKIILKEHTKGLSVSIGIIQSVYGEDLARKADDVLYKAKKSGKNQYLFEVESH
jgi:diguanylate cyclase